VFDGLDTTVQAVFVGQDAWPAFAERVTPHLDLMAGGSGGRYEASDIVDAIHAGRMQLWVALDGPLLLCALVTEIAQYPRLRAMRCVGIVGHRPRRWMHLLRNVEVSARMNFGCSRMEALTQPGHERLLTTGGWAAWHVMSEKAL
jgi:hypothetical protein